MTNEIMRIDLRDWLAQNATEDDLKPYLGNIGSHGGYIKYRDRAGLREQARYEYADAMLKERNQSLGNVSHVDN